MFYQQQSLKEEKAPVLPPDAVEPQDDDKDLSRLIERIAAGDQSALAVLYDITGSLVFGLSLRIVSERSAAEEVFLDVYKQIWRQASLYNSERGAPMAWILTITRSRALDRIRAHKRDQKLKEQFTAEPQTDYTRNNPEKDFALSERAAMVRAALGDLPPEQRDVIELAYYSGLSHSEIAAQLNQPLGTVKTRVRLGMIKLRELLSPAIGEGL